MTATDDALAQLNTLLQEYNELITKRGQMGLTSVEAAAMINRFQAAVARLTVPTSAYVQEMGRWQSVAASSPRLRALAGIVTALRDDIQAGWLASVIELAHADTYGDYLEMAEGLNAQKYKDAARSSPVHRWRFTSSLLPSSMV